MGSQSQVEYIICVHMNAWTPQYLDKCLSTKIDWLGKVWLVQQNDTYMYITLVNQSEGDSSMVHPELYPWSYSNACDMDDIYLQHCLVSCNIFWF